MKGSFQPISMMADSALTTSVTQKCDEPDFIKKELVGSRKSRLKYECQSQPSFTVLEWLSNALSVRDNVIYPRSSTGLSKK